MGREEKEHTAPTLRPLPPTPPFPFPAPPAPAEATAEVLVRLLAVTLVNKLGCATVRVTVLAPEVLGGP